MSMRPPGLSDKEYKRLTQLPAWMREAIDEHLARVNDPDSYLPTHSGPGRWQADEAEARYKRIMAIVRGDT